MFRRAAVRCCAPGPGAKRGSVNVGTDAGVLGGVADVDAPRTSAEATKTKFTMDEFEEKIHQTAEILEKDPEALNPEAPDASELLQKSFRKFKETETQQGRISEEDGLFNMTPSGIEAKPIRALKVFYKTVGVEEVAPGWWGVKLDGRNAKAFESEDNLVLPNEEFAYAVAHEWASQGSVINRFSMPLTDVASGAHQVQPDGLPNRLGYALEFFKHDHLFYREEHIREEQDEMIEPILEWADRYFDIKTPRVEGIRRCTVEQEDIDKMRRYLENMNLNKYQVVGLTVLCQYMASLILPLAVVNNATSLQIALLINRIEELNNIKATSEVEGYHDIRHLDSVVKMSACHAVWGFTQNLQNHECYADPAILRKSTQKASSA